MGNAARRAVGYGQGVASIDEENGPISNHVLARLRAVFAAPGYRPPVLPTAAIQLLELTRKPNVTVDQILALLEKDPMMCGALLRQARSAQYTRGNPVQSLREAIVRLGLREITNLFLEVAMNMRVFRVPGYEEPMALLRRHSAAVATCAQHVARTVGVFDEYAFLCGLLHDVGLAACAIAVTESFPRGKAPPFETLFPVFREAHEEAGRLMCMHWGLPAEIAAVVGNHHQHALDGQVHPLLAIIAVSEALAEMNGFGMEYEGGGDVGWALSALGLHSLDALSVAVKPSLARVGA